MEDDNHLSLEEYKEATALYRHHLAIFLGEITVYLGVMGALASAINPQLPPAYVIQIAICLVGIVLSIAFLLIVNGNSNVASNSAHRAIELEAKLGFSLFNLPLLEKHPGLFDARIAINMIFGSGIVGWTILLLFII